MAGQRISQRDLMAMTDEELRQADLELMKDDLRRGWTGRDFTTFFGPGRRVCVREPIRAALRWRVWERDNFTCQRCGIRRFLTIDHIIPVIRGGKSIIENLQTLCNRCNSEKHAR